MRINKMHSPEVKLAVCRDVESKIYARSYIYNKYGVNKSNIKAWMAKYKRGESFESQTGRAKKPNAGKQNRKHFESDKHELEYRRMVMAIEGKLQAHLKCKNK